MDDERFPPRILDQAGKGTDTRIRQHLSRVARARPDVRGAVKRAEGALLDRLRAPTPRLGAPLGWAALATVALVAGVVWFARRPAPAPGTRPAAETSRRPPPRFASVVPRLRAADEVVRPAAPRDLDAITATYLGGPGDDRPTAVEIAPGGTIVYAGALDGTDLGVAPARLGAGPAAIVRLGGAGREVLSVTRVGDAIADMKVDRSGRIYVVGRPFGLLALDERAADVRWRRDVAADRVAVGADGTVAVLDAAAARVELFTSDGAPAGAIALDGARESYRDVAVHGGTRTVVVTGAVPGHPEEPVVRAFGYDGQPRWQDYGWTGAEAMRAGVTASATGIRLTVGRDDRLYLLGESNGGNSAFFRRPRRLDLRAENLIGHDRFTSPTRVGNQYIIVVARLSPADGAVEAVQFHLTRNENDRSSGRTMWGRAIAADESGRVFLAGQQACCMEGAELTSVRGKPVRPSRRDAFVMVVAPDFRSRELWHSFGTGAPSEGLGVAVGNGIVATVAVQDKAASDEAPLVTVDALQPRPAGGGSDAYLAVFPATRKSTAR